MEVGLPTLLADPPEYCAAHASVSLHLGITECATSHIQTATAELIACPCPARPAASTPSADFDTGAGFPEVRAVCVASSYLRPNNEETFHAQRGGDQRLLRTPDEKAATCMQRMSKGRVLCIDL